jgi:hypothetical protein
MSSKIKGQNMLYNKKLLSFFLFITMKCIFTSENIGIIPQKPHNSFLKLFDNEDFESVALLFPYIHMSEEIKNNHMYLQEGCYTVLQNSVTDPYILVGPTHPGQIFYLLIDLKVVIAHVAFNFNFLTLLNDIIKHFPNHDMSDIKGRLFTTKCYTYDKPTRDIDGKLYSYKDIYQNRSQEEELKKNKQLIIDTFKIKNRSLISATIFKPGKRSLGNYPFADLFYLINPLSKGIFSICPIHENCLGISNNVSIKEKCMQYYFALEKLDNPAFKESKNTDSIYSSKSFLYVEAKKD